MADHDTHDHTGVPGVATGSVATDPIWAAEGDIVVATGDNAAAVLTKGATGTVPTAGASTLAYAFPPGYEVDYVEKTSSTTINGTNEAGANIIVTSNSVTFDGTACWFEFYCPQIASPNGVNLFIVLFDNTASTSAGIGRLAVITNATSQTHAGTYKRKLTPSAGARTFSVRGYVASSSGVLQGGPGGTTAYMPTYLRISKA